MFTNLDREGDHKYVTWKAIQGKKKKNVEEIFCQVRVCACKLFESVILILKCAGGRMWHSNSDKTVTVKNGIQALVKESLIGALVATNMPIYLHSVIRAFMTAL